MSTCQPNSVPRVKVNVLYSICSLYLLFLFNLFPILFKIDKFCPYRRCDQIYVLYQSYNDVNFNILYKNI